jgi:membrane fusion protein, multidrug efflux system
MADRGAVARRELRAVESTPEALPEPARRRRTVRWVLLALGPIVAIVLGLHFYLAGGRFVTTDNAYVQADKLNISTDVAGAVAEVAVREGQRVEAGTVLFRIDDEPYRIALAGAQAQLAAARNEISALQASYREKLEEIRQAETDISYWQREFGRQAELGERRIASQSKVDEMRRNVDVARQKIAALKQQAQGALAQLGGNPDLPAEKQARFLLAQAQVEKAERDLRRTVVVAPMPAIVTNVDKLQVGQYLTVAQAAFSLVSATQVWVDANPKETDLAYVKPGDPATVTVDSYPGRTWKATVASISPATGAEFSLIPPQNASGNWVKVVQRIPVRLKVEVPEGAPALRAGMSAEISIDTGRERSLGDLFSSARRWVGL